MSDAVSEFLASEEAKLPADELKAVRQQRDQISGPKGRNRGPKRNASKLFEQRGSIPEEAMCDEGEFPSQEFSMTPEMVSWALENLMVRGAKKRNPYSAGAWGFLYMCRQYPEQLLIPIYKKMAELALPSKGDAEADASRFDDSRAIKILGRVDRFVSEALGESGEEEVA